MHHDVLGLLDAHLAELTALRHVLAAPRPVHPGERWAAALETVRSADRYSQAVGALMDPAPV
ncbi:hypothetical protein ABT369_00880 [Dactylosporangium sp. NPDC000244]|uniref:hypothetical protein n=1 Tax=Dactylosporangium sp. NPDC000244 TaxID=3154365 RepID=UPI00331F98F3|nr:hypothetical protein GCM10020063_061550 [Dactylosporangium thailandense]